MNLFEKNKKKKYNFVNKSCKSDFIKSFLIKQYINVFLFPCKIKNKSIKVFFKYNLLFFNWHTIQYYLKLKL
jgi:hypothetical protein